MMSIENYKKKLESMSKEELLYEISNLISDHGIQLEQLKEEKKTLVWLNQDLEKQVDELKIAEKDTAKKLAQHLYDMKDLYWDENEVNPQIEILLDPQKFKRICEYYFGVEVE
jgi:hypothetical protein